MRFYRRLMPFKVISFDLDDTLYHNSPVMLATDIKMVNYFQKHLPYRSEGKYDYHFWRPFRDLAIEAEPELHHDVAKIRVQSYFLGIKSLGYTDRDAQQLAERALAYFVEQRSNFIVPDNVHQLLQQLQQKWPLVAISNGNVDTESIGIAHYFSTIYHAGNGLKKKPDEDMFARTCRQFNLHPSQLLHVGDCGINDIIGALRFGCQTAWVSSYDVGKPLTILPHIELTDVTELHSLV